MPKYQRPLGPLNQQSYISWKDLKKIKKDGILIRKILVNIKKLFYLSEENKKKSGVLQKNYWNRIKWKKQFFTEETKIGTAPLLGDKRRLTRTMKKNKRMGH